MMKSEPEADGTYRVSTEALFAEAERLAREPNVVWQPDGEPRVSVHPVQSAVMNPSHPATPPPCAELVDAIAPERRA